MTNRRGTPAWSPAVFPLTVSGRYLISPSGRPFYLHADTAWSLEVQCTHAQIDQYLNDRAARGVTAILFECMEHEFSSQSPAYRNVQSSADPFTTMSPVAWTSPTEAYWLTVDYIVNGCLARGIAAMMTPAYLGYQGGSEGWMTEVSAASAGDLQTYGARLARRFTQPNVIWCMGGDYAGTTGERNQQWNIVTGIRSVRTTDIITGHPARTDVTAYAAWNGYAGFNLNSIYIPTTDICDDIAATAYGQGMPFVMIEGGYEGTATAAQCRLGMYQSFLSGACGHFFGNTNLWRFGATAGVAATALANDLNTTGAQQLAIFGSLLKAYDWHKLVPKIDSSLVTTSLGTSGTTGRVCPALSSDGRFAMIWTPSVNLTVDMSVFKIASVRGRWFNPSDGSWAAASGSPFANSGTQAFTAPGERVLVLD